MLQKSLMKWPNDCTSMVRHLRALLRRCARSSSIDAGQQLHATAITSGLVTLPKTFLRNILMHMYASCCDSKSARELFDEIPLSQKDTVDWTTLMDCYTREGLAHRALPLFVTMRREGVPIDEITMVSLFGACAKLGECGFGVQGKACMVKMGLGFGVKTVNSALNMYVKSGMMVEGRRLFDEMSEMRNGVSWIVLLWGVLKWEGLGEGKVLFDEMPERNEVAWSLMIGKCVEDGYVREAFKLLSDMQFVCGLRLDFGTLCSLLSSCTRSGDVVVGKWVHAYAMKQTVDFRMDVKFCTALLDMYAKCGRIESAMRVFNSMHTRNVVTWNAMLSGLAMHGGGSVVLDMFSKMLKEVKPDDATFTAVLSACSHSGLVDEGRKVFHSIESVYGVKPSMKNYACMVDLLGRSGNLEEAEAVIRRMPMSPNEVVLGSLLAACSVQGRHGFGERMLQELVQLDPHNTEHHVLLSNMYSSSGNSRKADFLRRDLRDKGIRKVPGISSMFISGQIHQFTSGDKSHPRINEIHEMR